MSVLGYTTTIMRSQGYCREKQGINHEHYLKLFIKQRWIMYEPHVALIQIFMIPFVPPFSVFQVKELFDSRTKEVVCSPSLCSSSG